MGLRYIRGRARLGNWCHKNGPTEYLSGVPFTNANTGRGEEA